MAIPIFKDATNSMVRATIRTHDYMATVDEGDIIIAVVTVNGFYGGTLVTIPTRFNEFYTSTRADDFLRYFYWKRALGTEGGVTDTWVQSELGTGCSISYYRFSGCIETGTPFEELTSVNNFGTATANTITHSNNVSLGNERLACMLYWQDDNLLPLTRTSANYTQQDEYDHDEAVDNVTALDTMDIADSSVIDGDVQYDIPIGWEWMEMVGFLLKPVIVPLDDLFAYYDFNGHARDIVGGFDANTLGVGYLTGKSGQAVDFSGALTGIDWRIPDNDIFSFGDGINDRAFSLSFYINWDVVSSEWLIQKRTGNTTDAEWQLVLYAGVFYYTLFNGGVKGGAELLLTYTWAPTAGTWYHIVASYDGSGNHTGLTLYIDGVDIVGATSEVGIYVAMSNTTADVILGRAEYNAGFPLDGQIDGLGFWNKELSQNEVTAIFDEQNAGRELRPITWYIFDGTENAGITSDFNTNVLTGDFTFVVKMKVDSAGIGIDRNIFESAVSSDFLFQLRDTNGFRVSLRGGGSDITRDYSISDFDLNDDTFHTVVVTYTVSGGELRFYVDGLLITENLGFTHTGQTNSHSINIGTSVLNDNFQGLIEAIRLYDEVLDIGAIALLSDNILETHTGDVFSLLYSKYDTTWYDEIGEFDGIVGANIFIGQEPETSPNVEITPTTIAFNLTLLSPTITAESGATNVEVLPNTIAFTQTLLSPTVSAVINADIGLSLITFTQTLLTPTVSVVRSVDISASLINYTLNLLSPTIQTGGSIDINVGTISFTQSLLSPTVQVSRSVDVNANLISFGLNLLSPSVSAGGSINVLPNTIAFEVNLLAPTVIAGVSFEVIVDTINFNLTLLSPTLEAGGNVNINAKTLNFDINLLSPSVQAVRHIEINTILQRFNITLLSPNITITVDADLIRVYSDFKLIKTIREEDFNLNKTIYYDSNL